MDCVRIRAAPSVEACVIYGEYRAVGAKPLLKEGAGVDLSDVYGEWFDLTQLPPNISVIITDGRDSYAAYVPNSAATVLVRVPNARKYAVWLTRALERSGLAYLIDQATAAELEEGIKARRYDVELLRRKVRELAERPLEELAGGVEALVEAEPLGRRAEPFVVVPIGREALCAEVERLLREVGLNLAEFYDLLKRKEFRLKLVEVVRALG